MWLARKWSWEISLNFLICICVGVPRGWFCIDFVMPICIIVTRLIPAMNVVLMVLMDIRMVMMIVTRNMLLLVHVVIGVVASLHATIIMSL